jgi:hypothetical protein
MLIQTNGEEKGEKVRRYKAHMFGERKLAEVILKRRSELVQDSKVL